MALVVEQRPQEELFAEDNPTVYDTPYYTSRVNAANLPMVYNISNTKFPVNSEDAIENILSVSNNGGFAQLTLDTTTYTFVEKGFVEITNTSNYNGVFTIREVIDSENIVVNVPFVATETGNVQNYHNNYSTLIKVYAGLPEYHPLSTEKPITLITDNPLTITPLSDNIATVDVSALVKSTLTLNNDYELNDINLFTSFYIEYSEQYDESDGNTINTIIEPFQEDILSGCDSGVENFITNGNFDTNLNGWDQIFVGTDFVFDTGRAKTVLSTANRRSKLFQQTNINLTEGTEYDFSMDYDMGSETVIVTIFNGGIIYQDELSGTGTISISFIAELTRVSIDYNMTSSPASSVDTFLDNVSITNQLVNPCIAYIFASHSAQQPQYRYGGNMGEYVQNFNGGVFANKWLTLMKEPVLFEGNYFDLSTIIPQSVIQAAIQAGGFFVQIIELDRNATVIKQTNYPVTENLGDGIYRFRLDDKDFDSLTKSFTVQMLRIPLNLFVDGQQGTFDTTIDPNGNPPNDWNLEKDGRSVINYETVNTFEGAGSLAFESRSVFNDDYGLRIDNQGQVNADEGQYFEIKNLTGITNAKTKFTLEIRHRLDSFDGQFPFLASFNFVSSTIIMYYIGQNNIRLRWGESGNFKNIDVAYTLGQFNHFVFVWESGVEAKLYLNGIKTSSIIDINLTSLSPLSNFNILQGGGSTDYNATGYAKGVRYWDNYAATDADVTLLYNGDRKNPQTIPVGMPQIVSETEGREFLLNQEQGRTVFEKNNNNEDLNSDPPFNNAYTNEHVRFGGGAWVDVSGIN